jgi:hypothetical protein
MRRTGAPLVARNALRIRRDEMLVPAESSNVRSRQKLTEGFYRRLPGLTLSGGKPGRNPAAQQQGAPVRHNASSSRYSVEPAAVVFVSLEIQCTLMWLSKPPKGKK